MKKCVLSVVILFVLAFGTIAQNDTMYIMKSGFIVGKYNVNSVDSIIFYKPEIKKSDSFVDGRDGNVYRIVVIGNQIWMAENLRYLPSVVAPTTSSPTTAYYYIYGYSGTNVSAAKATDNYKTYGVLYNWPAAMAGAASSDANPSGVQGVCPAGWHLPSDEEWIELENYLSAKGYNFDGTTGGGRNKIAKAMASATGWNNSTNTGAPGNTDYPEYQNKSGFNGLPGGYRKGDGTFENLYNIGYWWSSTSFNINHTWTHWMIFNAPSVGKNDYNKSLGFSVRCAKD